MIRMLSLCPPFVGVDPVCSKTLEKSFGQKISQFSGRLTQRSPLDNRVLTEFFSDFISRMFRLSALVRAWV